MVMKRTTVTLPQELVEALMVVTKAKNKTQAVVVAIKDEIRKRKLELIRKMAGEMEFVREAEEIRHGDHRIG